MVHIKEKAIEFFHSIPEKIKIKSNKDDTDTATPSTSATATVTTPSAPPAHRESARYNLLRRRPSDQSATLSFPSGYSDSTLTVMSKAILANDADTIKEKAETLHQSPLAVERLMELALQEKGTGIEVKKAIANLPGAKPAKLLVTAARHRDYTLASHLLASTGVTVPALYLSELCKGAAKLEDLAMAKNLLGQGAVMTQKQATALIGAAVTAEVPDPDLAIKLAAQGGAMSTEQATQLLSAALDGNDMHAALQLVQLGAQAQPQHVDKLLTVAITGNDPHAAQRLLQQGANPLLLDAATVEGAQPAMQDFLRQANTVYKLYHMNDDGSHAKQSTELDKTLAAYDFAKARELLDKEKSAPAMPDAELWRQHGQTEEDATKRLDIKRAIMTLGDHATLSVLTTPGADGVTDLSRGMRTLKNADPELLRLYKTHPYRSGKHADHKDLNIKVDFKDSDKPIACAPLAAKWLLQRMGNGNKSDYGIFRDENAIRDNVTKDVLDAYFAMYDHAAANHLMPNGEFGAMAANYFREMEKEPPAADKTERAMHMLALSEDHAMGIELKRRFADGKTSYVLHVYDPNSTNGDKRIALDDLKAVEKLDFEALLPLGASSAYWGDKPENHLTRFAVVSNPAGTQTGASKKTDQLTTCTGVVSESLMHHLVNGGFTKNMEAMLPAIKDHLKNLGKDDKIAFLEAHNGRHPLFHLAMNNLAQADTARLYCQLVLDSDLPSRDKARLLAAQNQEGRTALSAALRKPEMIAAILGLVLDSELDFADKKAVFSAPDERGNHLLHLACAGDGRENLVGAMCNAVLDAEKLSAGEKVTLLSAGQQGMTPLQRGAERGCADNVAAFFEVVRESTLSDYYKHALLHGVGAAGDGTPAMQVAAANGHSETVTAMWDEVLESTLDADYKIDLLSSLDPQQRSLLATAVQRDDTELAAHLFATLIGGDSGLPLEEVIGIATKEYEGMTPLAMAVNQNNGALIRKFAEAISENEDLSKEQALALFAPLDSQGQPALAALTPSEEMINAYSTAAQITELEDEPCVKDTIDKWKAALTTASTATGGLDEAGQRRACRLVADGAAEELQAMLPQIRNHLATLDTEGKKAFLKASGTATPPFHQALAKGHGDTAQIFCQLVLDSDLSSSDKAELLQARLPNGRSALAANGRPDQVALILQQVLDSGLDFEDKRKLFSATNESGTPLLPGACATPYAHKLIGAMCDAVLGSNLSDDEKERLLADPFQNRPPLQSAAVHGQSENARIFCEKVAASSLPAESIARLLLGVGEDETPALHAAINEKKWGPVEAMWNAVLASPLEANEKIGVLKALDAKKVPLLYLATRIVGAGHLGKLYDKLLNGPSNLSVEQKIDVLTATSGGVTAFELSITGPDGAKMRKFGDALAANSDLSKEQKLALITREFRGGPIQLLLPPSKEALDAYTEVAEKLGLRNEEPVEKVIGHWKSKLNL
jgi:hypothetical protein